MDFNNIQQLIQMFEKSNTRELKIDDGDFHIYLTKNTSKESVQNVELELDKPQQTLELEENKKVIKAPLVGTVYLAPSSTSEPYVHVGSNINKGDTVCIVEAMKLMTEITSDISGTIEEIKVENGELVEVGQPLFTISTKEKS